jgi:septal ring-binding cell division protein DamX
MDTTLKVDENSDLDNKQIDSVSLGNISNFPHRLSADEIEQVRKITLLERQINALYVVSKKLDTKEKNSSELLTKLKERLFSLSNKQDNDVDNFASESSAIKNTIEQLASQFKQGLDDYKSFHADQHQQVAQYIDKKIDQVENNQAKQLISTNAKVETLQLSHDKLAELQSKEFNQTTQKTEQLEQWHNILSTTQQEHSEQLSDLRDITKTLTNISDKLTDKVSQHDGQINQHDGQISQLETVSTEQQNSINELFDQTHDLVNTDKKLSDKQSSLQAEISSLEEQHHTLLASTLELKKQQQEISTRVNKKFKLTHAITSLSFAVIAALGSAYYVQNNETIFNIQAQTESSKSSIVLLNTQVQDQKQNQTIILQQITDLEQQLVSLNDSLRNKEIDIKIFEQRQDAIGLRLNQLASQVTFNQSELSTDIINQADKQKNQADKQKFYKQIQFIRANDEAVYDQSWIDVQKNNHYSIQLMSTTKKAGIMSFIKNIPELDGKLAFRKTIVNEKVWYSIINGSYANKDEAIAAIDNLPTAVLPNKPWVRSFKQLKSK